MDPTVLLILAILGFWVCAGVGAALMLGWLIRRARRRHEAEVFAALCEAVERHPAGYRRPVRADCGAWIGATDEGFWDIQFKRIAHVSECTTCQHETQLPNRKDAA